MRSTSENVIPACAAEVSETMLLDKTRSRGTEWHVSEGKGWVEWKKLDKGHTCIYAQPSDTDNTVVEVGKDGWVEGSKGGEIGDICITVGLCTEKINS